jgi:hypothetical protein
MDISPNYSTADWNRLDLSNPFSKDDDWGIGIEIFEDRIRGRFLNIVGNIQSAPFSGFVVMAIDCLLVETLEQFYRGVPDSVGGSKAFFTNFFERSDVLKKEFTESQRELFYDHFRCGILHQAEIKGDSLVWKVGQLVWENQPGSITINRQKFHEILACEFSAYTQKLRDKANFSDLRLRFRTKMDYICRNPQYYFGFRPDVNHQTLQAEVGPVEVIGPATANSWKVKTNKKGYIIGLEPEDNNNVAGNVYRLSVAQLDKLSETIEKDNKPNPLQVVSQNVPEFQMVWGFSR